MIARIIETIAEKNEFNYTKSEKRLQLNRRKNNFQIYLSSWYFRKMMFTGGI